MTKHLPECPGRSWPLLQAAGLRHGIDRCCKRTGAVSRIFDQYLLAANQFGHADFPWVARYDVQMDVINARTCRITHVVANIIACRLLDGIKCIKDKVGKIMQFDGLVGIKLADIQYMLFGEHEHMTGVKRIQIHAHQEITALKYGQVDDRWVVVANAAQNAFGFFLSTNVGEFFKVEKIQTFSFKHDNHITASLSAVQAGADWSPT